MMLIPSRSRRLLPELAVALTIGALHASAAQTTAPSAQIDVSTNHVLVPGVAKGRALTLLLDTGTADSYLDFGVAQALGGIAERGFGVSGAGPGLTQAASLRPSLTIDVAVAGAPTRQEIQRVMDMTATSAVFGRDIDGILGNDFIRRFVLEIDYGAQRLTLHPKDHVDGRVQPQRLRFTLEGFPVADVTLQLPDSKRLSTRAMLDTGSGSAIVISEPFHRKHQLAARLGAGDEMPLGIGAGGRFFGRMARLPVLEMGELRFNTAVVALPGAGSGVLSKSESHTVNIGGDVFRRSTVLFDLRRSRVSFIPNSRVNDPFEAGMTGLGLTTLGRPYDRIVIDTVAPLSAGAVADARPGDRLLAIDGVAVGGLSLTAIRQRFKVPEGTRFLIEVQRGNERVALTLTTRRVV